MQYKGFIGPSYELRNIQADSQNSVNWFVEVIESGVGKNGSIMQLVPTKGMLPIITNLVQYSRGGHLASNGVLYWVNGDMLYRITPGVGTTGWTATSIGSVVGSSSLNNTSPCRFEDNGLYLFIISNGTTYVCNLATNALSLMGGAGVTNFSSCTYMDTYIVFSATGTNQFYWTDPLTNTVPALNFASAEASPDIIQGIINHSQDLWIFNKKTIELWYDYGQGSTVFAQREGILIETGCMAPGTIKKIDNTLAWLSGDDRGGAQLMIANGYTPQRVSLHPIEEVWQASTTAQIEQSTAYVYQDNGHHFYCLNIPGQTSTWVFDLTSTKLLGKPCWHERQSNNSNGNYFRNIAQGHVYFNGYHIVGGVDDTNLYVLDQNTFTDNGHKIIRERTAPGISNEMKNVFYDRLQVDFMTGSTTSATLDPQIMMQFSDDGGHTWSNEIWTTCGTIGSYKTIVQFRQLGVSRDRVYRVRASDGQYWAISGAALDIRLGTH